MKDVAIALGDVVEHPAQRVVSCGENFVLCPQRIGRVFEPILQWGVGKEREDEVVEHSGTYPHQHLNEEAGEVVTQGFAPTEVREI
jgi:hypothetical protein